MKDVGIRNVRLGGVQVFGVRVSGLAESDLLNPDQSLRISIAMQRLLIAHVNKLPVQ